jgi:hypothetical protein
MKVSRAIALLSEENPDSEVMVQWFTKEHVEANMQIEITDSHWEGAVSSFDEGDVSMDDFQVQWCLDDAAEKLEEVK